METYVVRLWLPDRPGALGQVASRIGAARGDVVGIDILDRGAGQAIDELTIELPDPSWLTAMLNEVLEVDGVAIERVRRLEWVRPEPTVHVLEVAARLAECVPLKRVDQLCAESMELVEAAWAAAVSFEGPEAAVSVRYGDVPNDEWLLAFGHGMRFLPAESALGADDVVWMPLEHWNGAVMVGRPESPFRDRERRELTNLARIVDAGLVG